MPAITGTQQKPSTLIPLVLIGVLFFVFGFVTWLNGILIPYFKIALDLTSSQSTLVTFAFFIAYFVMAIPSSAILKKTGFKKGMMIGLFVMAIGALIFVPAAKTRTYELFLLALFVLGTGLALLQTAVNPYVTILGPIESAAKRISFMGICNKVAGVVSQRLLGGIFLIGADVVVTSAAKATLAEKAVLLDAFAIRMVNPYFIMTGFLILLGFFVLFAPLPEVKEEIEEADINGNSNSRGILSYPNAVFGVIALFFAVGVEVIAGDYIISYGTSLGFTLQQSKPFTEYVLYAMLAGYISGALFIPKIITQKQALNFCAASGVLFSIGAIFTSGYTSIYFVIAMGFSNSLLWPCIWPLSLNGLGKHTKLLSAFLIMAIAGGALLPIVFGKLLEAAVPQRAFVVMGISYLVILYFALAGHKKMKW
jgi:MFS transporter, FHS family, L-fucose permease